MKSSQFLKHALWVAPLSFLLAFVSPRSTAKAPPPPPKLAERDAPRPPQVVKKASQTLPPELATAADCQKAFADLDTATNLHPLLKSALLDHALRRWLDLDPAHALEHAEATLVTWGDSFGKDLFRVWLDLDPDSALEGLALASPAVRQSVFDSFFIKLADLDPLKTIELIRQDRWASIASIDDIGDMIFTRAFGKLAETDPLKAIESYQENLKEKKIYESSSGHLFAIFESWGARDPVVAWEYFQSLEKNELSRHSDITIEQALALSLLARNPDYLDEFQFESTTIRATSEWIRSDLEGALNFADTLPSDHLWRAHLLVKAANRLASTDPVRALSLFHEGQNSPAVEGHLHLNFHESFYEKTFQMLNASEPEQARALLQSVPDHHRALALSGILSHELSKDPSSAVEQIADYGRDPSTSPLILDALANTLEWDGKNTSEIITALPEARQIVKGHLLDSWIRDSPEAAAAFLLEEFNTNPDYQLDSILAFSELAASRPEFTGQWLQNLPPGPVQTDAAVALALNWSNFDSPATEAWIDSLPDGPLKETAFRALTSESSD